MQSKMKYPIGIQTFEKIREGGYVYVDKTDLVYRLANDGVYYFLSRPRRFGKSLLISTLEAYFSGRKELFEGLAIEKLEKDWKPCPVLHFDFDGRKYTSVADFEEVLDIQLSQLESIYGKDDAERGLSQRFAGVIRRAYEKTGQRVAILVDEYDKPLLQNIDNENVHKAIHAEIGVFFSQFKSQDHYIRFALLTGVTKFVSDILLGELNNLSDISFSKKYESICGISKQELTDVFEPRIREMADANNLDYDTMLGKLQTKYGGYHFSEGMTDMFNPFSVLNALNSKDMCDYLFDSNTPLLFYELIKKHGNDVLKELLDDFMIGELSLKFAGNTTDEPIPLMYLNGLLTISDYDRECGLYRLKIPNEEVRGFFECILTNDGKVKQFLSHS